MAKKNKVGKKLAALIITVLVFLVITGLHLLGSFNTLEYRTYDMRVRFWANSTFSRPSDEIVVITLDEESLNWAELERGWSWPWPRQAYAEIINFLSYSGAKSVAFDILFPAPSVYRTAVQDELIASALRNLDEAQAALAGGHTGETGPIIRNIVNSIQRLGAREDDASFIEASRNYDHVVQAVMFSSDRGVDFSWPSGLNVPLFQHENFGSALERFSVGETEKALFPIPGLRKSARALGSVTGAPDSDGVIRRARPFTTFDGKAVPSLSSGLLIAAGRGRQISFDNRTNTIDWEGISIPVDKNGKALLRYRGTLDRYHPYRAMDILLSAEAHARGETLVLGSHSTSLGIVWGMFTPSNFTDTYVVIGATAIALHDIFNTPISPVYPGMGNHITMLDNMLQNDFIRESAEWLNLLLLLIVVILAVGLTMFCSRISLTVGGIVVIVAVIFLGTFAVYQFGSLWVPMITCIAGTLAGFVTVTLYNYATEGSQKRFIKSAFSQYLSPKVVEQLILDPSQLKLGGEKREMTAIFTDIRAFSTFSEALGDPAKLVDLLNFYLTRMSNIVLDNQGTIDKYEGDAIIAFFGAPVRLDNHASLACRATIMMKRAEAAINREALSLGLITPEVMHAMAKKGAISSIDDPNPIFTRLGINTGDMVVGNMGTPNKMDYTIMGNAVNLAARLEGVNKQYDTGGILISEYTRAFIGDEFILRPLSRVRVVGINTPLRLYELLDIASEAKPELLEMVKNWEKAFTFYEKMDFTAARDLFQVICDKNDKDMAAKKYLNRCVKGIASPPDEKSWDDGVDNLTEK